MILPVLVVVAAAINARPYTANRVTAIATRQALPASTLSAFGALAENGTPFQATDVIMRSAPPVFAVRRSQSAGLRVDVTP